MKEIAELHRPEAAAVHSTICFSSIDSDQGLEILTSAGAENFERTIEAASIEGQGGASPIGHTPPISLIHVHRRIGLVSVAS